MKNRTKSSRGASEGSGTPGELAHSARFLLAHDSREIGGTAVPSDSGVWLA